MKTPTHFPFSVTHPQRGVALITVLSLLALLTILIVTFFSLAGQDRVRARTYLDLSKSNILIDNAVEEAIAKIIEGSEVPWGPNGAEASMTASPGLMEIRYYRENPNRGYHTGTTPWQNENSFFRNPFAEEYEISAGNFAPANPRWIPLFSWKWFAPGKPWLSSRNQVWAIPMILQTIRRPARMACVQDIVGTTLRWSLI